MIKERCGFDVVGGGVGKGEISFPAGTVDIYANLPDYTTVIGQIWFVENPKTFSLHPRGFYEASSTGWVNTTIKVKISEDAGSLLNWTNWSAWQTASEDVQIGDRVVYNDIEYKNATGTQTATPPDQDALNWDYVDTNLIRYYNDTGADIPPFRVLHLKSATIISGKEHPTPELANAKFWEQTQGTLSVSCETILDGQFGCSVKGTAMLEGGDTSGLPPGSQLWLSDDGSGELTNIKPEFPSYAISIGGNYNQQAAPNGKILVSITTDIYDTFNDGWNGCIRESFDFLVTSDGVNIIGTLTNQFNPSDNLTAYFSDGFYTIDTTTAPLEITLTAGTATSVQLNFVYFDKPAKTFQVALDEFPDTEHSKIAIIGVFDAVTTQSDGVARNQNINDHIKTVGDNGHILHIAERIRALNAVWRSGTASTLNGTPTNGYIAITSGVVWQLHKQTVPANDMALGDEAHIVNDPVTGYRLTTNLNTITTYSDGSAWNNEWSNIVVWGVANKSGEASHIMINLPSDGYNSEENAVADRNNYTSYTIPEEFLGVGFLIGRYTVRLSGGAITYNPGVGYLDLRGSVPNNTVGGGTGSSGITDFTQLTDTPNSYSGQAGKILKVNTGETALEFATTYAEYTDNAAALLAGLTAGQLYRTGDILKVVH